jgi:hypothetical protein
MKLDKDLVREILLAVEGSDHNPDEGHPFLFEDRTQREMTYHVIQLHDGGFLIGHDATVLSDRFPVWQVKRLTYKGHEFLDTVRDGEVWELTKAGADKVGSASIGLMLELGKAYGKQVLRDRLGIDLP